MNKAEQSFMINKGIEMPANNIEQEKNNPPYDLDSLNKLSWEIVNAADEAQDEVCEKMEEGDETFKQKVKEARTAVFKKYFEKLKDESDRFGHIFETEKGSIYFIAQDGGSLRFKNTQRGFS